LSRKQTELVTGSFLLEKSKNMEQILFLLLEKIEILPSKDRLQIAQHSKSGAVGHYNFLRTI
jgi:hypothetical protein